VFSDTASDLLYLAFLASLAYKYMHLPIEEWIQRVLHGV
jgi:hypothetical protein